MIINKIKLENIRSYLDKSIDFPKGSILLSGDVGAGKSTVLLAIEFALFGISKGYLSGSSILRNGKDKGSVTLDFYVNNNHVIIKRSLKRISSSVSQDIGYIEINGSRKDLSAIELKQEILNLLNYPQESLTKSKSLIYRYTVYTPQEEMKAILFSDKDSRLDILRRVFGIEKYKIIKENTKIVMSNLRERKKELEGRISNIQDLESNKKSLQSYLEELNKELTINIPLLEKSKLNISNQLNHISSIESEIKLLNEVKNSISLLESHLNNKQYEQKKILKEIDDLTSSLEKIESLESINIESINLEIESKEKNSRLLDEQLRKLSYEISSYDVQIKSSLKLKQDILSLKECPICKQQVNDSHKEHIESAENEKIKSAESSKKSLLEKEMGLKSEINNLKIKLNELQKTKYAYELKQFKIKTNQEKELKIKNLKDSISSIESEIESIKLNQQLRTQELNKFSDLEIKYKRQKEELDSLRNAYNQLELQKTRTETKINEFLKQMSSIEKDLFVKYESKKQLENITIFYQWLDSFFIPMVETLEKTTMSKINYEFNEVFQRWFKIIMDSESLNIRLDDSFTPIIEQNGYENEYENLSGGEKTAAALSYRLALNQVINGLVSSINTKDIIILDEPTDGFSEDQLDKIRSVMNELNTKQTILVSHESKIESFVDNIIRFNKKDHMTEINS